MKYLLCEAHGIGDCILILPFAKAIKEKDPKAYIKVFTKSDEKKIGINRSIMSLQKYVDEIDYYSKTEIMHSIRFIIENMLKRYDYGIVIQDYDTIGTSSIPSLVVNLCCKKTCGTLITNNKRVKYDYYVKRKAGERRDRLFFEAAKKLSINLSRNDGKLLDGSLIKANIPPINFVQKLPVVVLVVGTAPVSLKTNEGYLVNSSKAWPYINWINLSKRLADSGFNVILLGGKKEKLEIEHLSSHISNNDRIYNCIGKYEIKKSIAILELASVVVGADTGLMHCAGALGKNSLTLFGCTDPQEYLPFGDKSQFIYAGAACSPCFGTIKSVTCKEMRCMKEITVDMVFDKIVNILGSEQEKKQFDEQ